MKIKCYISSKHLHKILRLVDPCIKQSKMFQDTLDSSGYPDIRYGIIFQSFFEEIFVYAGRTRQWGLESS